MSTGFSLERSVFSVDGGTEGKCRLRDGFPPVLRASYSHVLPDGSGPSMGVAVGVSPSDPNVHNACSSRWRFPGPTISGLTSARS